MTAQGLWIEQRVPCVALLLSIVCPVSRVSEAGGHVKAGFALPREMKKPALPVIHSSVSVT